MVAVGGDLFHLVRLVDWLVPDELSEIVSISSPTSDDRYAALQSLGAGNAIPRGMMGMVVNQRNLDAHYNQFKWVGHCLRPNLTKAEAEKGLTLKEWAFQCEKAGQEKPRFAKRDEKQHKNFLEFQQEFGFPAPDPAYRPLGQQGKRLDADAPVECDFCGRYAPVSRMPACECGEFYCSAACRLADWQDHKTVCAQARDAAGTSAMIDRIWLAQRGVTHDLEGRQIDVPRGSRAPKIYSDGGGGAPGCPQM